MQWDECLNLDAILEEVLQQLIIPSLRPSMVELRDAELMSSSESRFKQPNILNEATSLKYSKQIEEILISRLPTRIQEAFNSSQIGTNKDVFSSTMAELNCFGNIDTSLNELETTGKQIGISPLEQLNRLPNIVKTIIDEVNNHLAFY